LPDVSVKLFSGQSKHKLAAIVTGWEKSADTAAISNAITCNAGHELSLRRFTHEADSV